jgi:hypothetical protein
MASVAMPARGVPLTQRIILEAMMVRARRPFSQIPVMTMLLLVLLATLPVLQVSSNTNTSGNQSADPATVNTAAAVMDRQSLTVAQIARPPVADIALGGQQPVAQLIPPPDGLQSVSFTLGDGEGARPQSGGAMLLASGEYAAKGHVIVVSTFQADGAADPSSLGRQPIVLADGTPAWATPGPHGKAPNQVALLQDGLIVTLSGDLSIDDLASLASAIVIRW